MSVLSKQGVTTIELLITLGIFAVLVSVSMPVWEKTSRDLQIERLLDTAVQGVLYVLGDARGNSVREGGNVYRVSTVTDETGTPTYFASGIRVEDSGVNKFYAITRWEIPKVLINTIFKPYVYDTLRIDFDPPGKYYYIFGSWVKEESSNYRLITGTASTTIHIYLTDRGTGTDAPQRTIRIIDSIPGIG
jgi:Tfp pilus assembly protein FimT